MRRALRWTAAAGAAMVAITGCAGDPVGADGSAPTVIGYGGTFVPLPGITMGDGTTPTRSASSPAPSRRTRMPNSSAPEPTPPQRVPAAARSFAWTASRYAVPEAFTLTVLRGLTVREALAAVAPDPDFPARPVRQTRRAVDRVLEKQDPDDQTAPSPQLVAAVGRGSYTLVLEDNNFLATEDRALRRLGRRGVAAVYFCNVNAATSFSVSRGGRIVRQFDPLLGYSDVGPPLPQERGLPFARDDTFEWVDAMTLELTRRVTGYRVRPTDFDMTTYDSAVAVVL